MSKTPARKKARNPEKLSTEKATFRVGAKVTQNVTQINSVQTRCIVKGEAQKNPLFWRFSGGF